MTTIRKIRFGILALDVIWIVAALWIASLWRSGTDPGATLVFSYPNSLAFIASAIVVWGVLYALMELDGFRWGWTFASVSSHVLASTGIVAIVLPAVAFLTKSPMGRVRLAIYLVLLLFGFLAIRCLARAFLFSRHHAGAVRRAVVVGNGNVARELAREIERHPEMLCQVVGFLYPGNDHVPIDIPAGAETVQTLGIMDLLSAKQVDELFVVLPQAPRAEFQKLIARCRTQGIRVSLVPQSYELYVSQPRLAHVGSLPLVSLEAAEMSWTVSLLKRAEDLIFVVVFGLPAAAVAALCALALRLEGKPAFRTETRCGLRGREFELYRLNVERGSNMSGLEKFLDRTSLTELPQLFNVFRGDMSMIGPRPESPDRVRHYSEWQRQRLNMVPGITGLAQVHGLREEHESDEKARYDLQYILRWSPLLDLSLIFQTVWTLGSRWRRSPAGRHVSVPFTRFAPEIATLEAVHADRTDSCTD